jgi:8-oxo-dGTP pyrophosphatase MutT (NUDIX family)
MTRRLRSSVVCIHDSKILVFKGVDPTSGKEYYFLPGGQIEDHETAPQSAIRETLEETGYKIKIDEFSVVDKDYTFLWNGESYDCTTLFYRGYLDQDFHPPKPVKDAAYNKGAFWLPVADINQIFSYHMSIYSAVKQLVK